jgi:hypothetical protein
MVFKNGSNYVESYMKWILQMWSNIKKSFLCTFISIFHINVFQPTMINI